MSRVKEYVSPQFQLTAFAIASVLLIAILYVTVYRFTTYDDKPHILCGVPAESNPKIIPVGFLVNSFSKFHVLDNEFALDGMVWFEFEPDTISVEDLEKFNINHGEIIERSKPLISKHGDKTLARYFIRAKFKTNLNYASFPFDNHIIYISFTNRALDARKFMFQPVVGFSLSQKDMLASTCTLNDIITESGYVTSNVHMSNDDTIEEYYPQFVYGIKCKHVSLRRFVNIFLPLLLIFFFTLFAFSLDFSEHREMVMSIAAAGIPALIAYRFVIETISPNTEYFLLSDYFFFLFLFLVFAIFIAIVASVHASERNKQVTIISLYTCMIICSAILLHWKL